MRREWCSETQLKEGMRREGREGREGRKGLRREGQGEARKETSLRSLGKLLPSDPSHSPLLP